MGDEITKIDKEALEKIIRGIVEDVLQEKARERRAEAAERRNARKASKKAAKRKAARGPVFLAEAKCIDAILNNDAGDVGNGDHDDTGEDRVFDSDWLSRVKKENNNLNTKYGVLIESMEDWQHNKQALGLRVFFLNSAVKTFTKMLTEKKSIDKSIILKDKNFDLLLRVSAFQLMDKCGMSYAKRAASEEDEKTLKYWNDKFVNVQDRYFPDTPYTEGWKQTASNVYGTLKEIHAAKKRNDGTLSNKIADFKATMKAAMKSEEEEGRNIESLQKHYSREILEMKAAMKQSQDIPGSAGGSPPSAIEQDQDSKDQATQGTKAGQDTKSPPTTPPVGDKTHDAKYKQSRASKKADDEVTSLIDQIRAELGGGGAKK